MGVEGKRVEVKVKRWKALVATLENVAFFFLNNKDGGGANECGLSQDVQNIITPLLCSASLWVIFPCSWVKSQEVPMTCLFTLNFHCVIQLESIVLSNRNFNFKFNLKLVPLPSPGLTQFQLWALHSVPTLSCPCLLTPCSPPPSKMTPASPHIVACGKDAPVLCL